ncbi:MAG: hypothetical protein COB77_05385 [Gammaproteobacteria bacterium]|nr:MAG: hypothetical protein COB77_05385 [Gammaproteobacteria bacterium]
MGPIVFREKGYRFYFLSKSEQERHVHVVSADGEAKYWLEPKIELAENNYYSEQQLNEVRLLIEHHRDELIDAWLQRFYSGS